MSVREKVVKFIQQQQSGRFNVIDNTGAEKKVIAGQFPDVIFLQKEPPNSNVILFVIKIENGGELVDSVATWKALGSAPSTFYIIVPKARIDEAKKLASATEVKAKFGFYETDSEGKVTNVRYE